MILATKSQSRMIVKAKPSPLFIRSKTRRLHLSINSYDSFGNVTSVTDAMNKATITADDSAYQLFRRL